MARFLTPAWIAALDRAARQSAALAQVAGPGGLVVQQVVEGGPDGPVAWHLVLGDGEASVHAGRAEGPTVTLTTDLATATAVNAGTESAQAAFMAGRLRLGGDVGALLAHREALAALDDVFAAVRGATATTDLG